MPGACPHSELSGGQMGMYGGNCQPNQPAMSDEQQKYQQATQQQNVKYGSVSPYSLRTRGTGNLGAMLIALFMPWLIFVILFWTMSCELRARQPSFCKSMAMVMLLIVGALGVSAHQAIVRARDGRGEPASWSIVVFVCSAIAFLAGFMGGNINFSSNMGPFYDITALNAYPNVDPSKYEGQSFMDAGQIAFTPGAHIDLSKNMGFMDTDMYCIAPIIMPNRTMEHYDFWAIGINCCSGQQFHYRCGEYNNVLANSGLRLMSNSDRPFFRLAVEQAEATYNIKAKHPIFFYWMQNPLTEINAYKDAGYKAFGVAASCFFAFQLFIVIIAAIMFSFKAYHGTGAVYKAIV